MDATALLADHGFAMRSAFTSELAERLRLKLLPGTPETADASTLFALALNHPFDARWLASLDDLCWRVWRTCCAPTGSKMPAPPPGAATPPACRRR